MRIRKILLFAGAALLALVLLMIFSSKASAGGGCYGGGVDNNIPDIPNNPIIDGIGDGIPDNIENAGDKVTGKIDGVAEKTKPDLTLDVTSDVKEKNNANIKKEDIVIVRISVKNTGYVPARDVKTNFYVDDKQVDMEETRVISPDTTVSTIGNTEIVGTDTTVSIEFSWKATPGEHSLAVVVDPYNEIDEINENNNMYTTSVNVVEGEENIVGSEPPPIISKDASAVAAAVGALSMFALLGLYSDKYRFFTLFAPLYTRIKKKHVLDHFTRGRIYGYIETNPGAHYNMIKDALGLNNGSLAYHLGMLEKTEYVISKKAGKCRYFYPNSGNISRKNGLSNLQNSILEKIVEAPEITQKEIADEIGVSQQVVSYNVKKMIKNGVLKTRENGRESYLYVAESFGA